MVWCDDVHGGGGIDVGGDVVACAPGDQCDGGCTLTRNTRSVRKLLYFDLENPQFRKLVFYFHDIRGIFR